MAAAAIGQDGAPPTSGPAQPDQAALQVQSVWDFIVKGGPVMIPIIACSLIALAVFAERLIALRKRHVIPRNVSEGVVERFRLLLCQGEDPVQLPGQGGFELSALLGKLGDLAVHRFAEGGDVHPCLLEQRLDYALILGEQRGKKVGVVDDRVSPLACEGSRVAEGLLGLNRESFGTDHGYLAIS